MTPNNLTNLDKKRLLTMPETSNKKQPSNQSGINRTVEFLNFYKKSVLNSKSRNSVYPKQVQPIQNEICPGCVSHRLVHASQFCPQVLRV